MKRREFLKMSSFVTVSVAALGVTACGSDDSSTTSGNGSIAPNPVRPMPPAATGGNWAFPQSVATGDPRSDSIMFWTRVVPGTLPNPVTDVTTLSAAIQLKVTKADNSASLGSTTALTGTLIADVTVPAYSDFDGTVRHKLTGLEANTLYFYQFVAGTVTSKVGRMKTAPAASSTGDVNFAFMSCQDWNANHWGAFAKIVADDGAGATASLDFIVHLGDYIYETAADSIPVEAGHTDHTLPSGGSFAQNTADYRYLYKRYRSDSRLQSMHERFPMIAIWDDHEFSDDCWQASETYTNTNESQPTRRRSANQAWYEYTAADISYSENDPGFQNVKIYRDLKFGQVMHLVMTDERLYRADHMIPENSAKPGTTGSTPATQLGRINSRYLAPEATYKLVESIKYGIDSADPLKSITMLGADQRAWWKQTMQGSSSTWKVWGNEVSLLRMGLNGTNALATLIPLSIFSTLTTSATSGIAVVATSLGTTSGPSAATVALISMGITPANAQTAAVAIATSAAGGGTDSDKVTAAITAVPSLTVPQATAAVGAFNNALAVGNITIASALVGAATANASSNTVAGQAAFAITAIDANPSATTAMRVAAAQSAGVTQLQAETAVAAYEAAKAAKPAGAATQVQAAANQISIKAGTDIATNKAASPFFIKATGASAAAAAAFFQKFLLNADQWDGYSKERKELMNFLINGAVQNVVSVTGDIHAFFAGQVYNDFAGEVNAFNVVGGNAVETGAYAAGTAALVDLVTAGVSSTSWFEYIKEAADVLDPSHALIGNLVYYPIDLSANFGEPAKTTVVNLNLLDYSMGKTAPANALELAAQLNTQIKRVLAAHGVPEVALDAQAASVQSTIAGDPTFSTAAFTLATRLATQVAANPWLKHIDTEAQGYAVVKASTTTLECTFKKLNPLVGTAAPGAARIVNAAADKKATVTAGAGPASLVISN